MSYPLRLPPNLDAAARERAAGIGISFNAFICVCVDAYINGAGKPAVEASTARAASQREQRQAKRSEEEFQSVADDAFGPDDKGHPDWRFFHPDPDYWPHVDPDPAWDSQRRAILEKYGDAVETANKALDREYWATRARPAYSVPGQQQQGKQRGKRTGRG